MRCRDNLQMLLNSKPLIYPNCSCKTPFIASALAEGLSGIRGAIVGSCGIMLVVACFVNVEVELFGGLRVAKSQRSPDVLDEIYASNSPREMKYSLNIFHVLSGVRYRLK